VIGGPVKWGVDKKVLYDPFADTPEGSVRGTSEMGDNSAKDDVTFDNSTILTNQEFSTIVGENSTIELGQDSTILDNATINSYDNHTYDSAENGDNTTATSSFQMNSKLDSTSYITNDNDTNTDVASGSGVGLVKWLKNKF
jgi:hypothetical protein